ncbi:MAG: hypothetical protein LC627_03175, partial [Verrucomicrobiaceae bacterium]|nr:hypothetical protein [Verrucomicrobiaceae bacterium]
LALSTSAVAISNFFFLYSMMRHYTQRLETGAMVRTLVKLLTAGAGLAAICWIARTMFFQPYAAAPDWITAIVMVLTICVGCAVFYGAAFLLRIAEVRDIVDLVRRRISRR